MDANVVALPREMMLVANARAALAEAKTIDQDKDIRDKAAAIKLYMQQAGESMEAQDPTFRRCR